MHFLRNAILAAGLSFLSACTTTEVKGYQDGHLYIRVNHNFLLSYQNFSYTPFPLKEKSLCTLSTYSPAATDFGEEFEGISIDDYGCDLKIERIMLISKDLHRSIAYDPKTKKFNYVWLDKTTLPYISSDNIERMADQLWGDFFKDYDVENLISKSK